MPKSRKNKNKNRGKRSKGRIANDGRQDQFADPSSSGTPVPPESLLRQDYAQWLYDDSGRDKIINYAFSDISGAYTVDDGFFASDNIVSAPVSAQERDYITGRLSFLGSQIGVQFVESSFEAADIRFFAAESGRKEYTGFATVGRNAPLDLVWERAGQKNLTPNIGLTISHEIGHGLGLEHVDEVSGLTDKQVLKKWGVSDSLMISWEMPYEFYDRNFSVDHQWFTESDINALRLAWSRVA